MERRALTFTSYTSNMMAAIPASADSAITGNPWPYMPARSQAELPKATREHLRTLVRAGIDGAGRPLVS